MKTKTKGMVTAALFTAIIAVMSQISVMLPSGVPITMQVFAVALCGCVLGMKYGTASVAVYILLGAAGIPIFSSFSGGIGILFGKTGGFIFGFIPMVIFCGLAVKIKNIPLGLITSFCGLILCHICGIAQFAFLYKMNPYAAALLVSFPYLIKDVVSVTVAYFVAIKLKKRFTALQ